MTPGHSLHAFIGLLLSVVAVGLLIAFVEPPDFGAALGRIRLVMLLPFVGSVAVLAALLALRWKRLTGPGLGYPAALSASLVGIGGNMVLPLRGGDLLKVARTSRRARVPLVESAGSLVVEKALDLAATATIGVFAIGILFSENRARMSPATLAVVGATLIALVLAFVAVRRYNGALQRGSSWLLERLALGALHRSLFQPLLVRLGGRIPVAQLLELLALTCVLHLVVYAFIYMYLGWLIGVELRYPEALLVLIAAAFGMTVPAAPSGVGVYHAAVASAFFAMDRPVSEGIALGVTVHAMTFVAFVIPTGVVWLRDGYRLARHPRPGAGSP